MLCPTCMHPLWKWAPAPRSSCPVILAFTCWGSRCSSAKIKESGATLCQAVNVRHRRKPLSDDLICLLTSKGVSKTYFACSKEFKILDNISLSCLCVTGVSCGPPHSLENGLFQGSDFHAGSSVVYQCNAGFYLLGDTKVHCANSGKWGGNPPACLGKT